MSNVQRKVKRKKKKQMTPIFKPVLLGFFGAAVYLTIGVVTEIYTTFELRAQVAKVEKELQDIKDQNTYLITQKSKLEDPDYVQSYARGNYMLTKDGEEIYYLPADEKK